MLLIASNKNNLKPIVDVDEQALSLHNYTTTIKQQILSCAKLVRMSQYQEMESDIILHMTQIQYQVVVIDMKEMEISSPLSRLTGVRRGFKGRADEVTLFLFHSDIASQTSELI